jgi:outer membrane immunogenic protein
MKKLLVAAALAGLSITSAFAADLAVKAPMYTKAVSPAYDWTGFYIGATVGGGEQRSGTGYSADPSFVNFGGLIQPAFANGSLATNTKERGDGVLGGLTLGYNWQLANWLVGVEGDFSGTGFDSKSSIAPPQVPGFPLLTTTMENRTQWLSTLRARFGALVSPQTLLFVTGGLAVGEIKSTANIIPGGAGGSTCANDVYCSTGTSDQTRAGWTVGAGGEYLFAPHWTLKVEYLHYDLGRFSYNASIVPNFVGTAGLPNVTVSTHVYGDIGRLGVNYKF